MDPAVGAIPTFGTNPMLTLQSGEDNGVEPTILMTCIIGIALLAPICRAIGFVGISRRWHG